MIYCYAEGCLFDIPALMLTFNIPFVHLSVHWIVVLRVLWAPCVPLLLVVILGGDEDEDSKIH